MLPVSGVIIAPPGGNTIANACSLLKTVAPRFPILLYHDDDEKVKHLQGFFGIFPVADWLKPLRAGGVRC